MIDHVVDTKLDGLTHITTLNQELVEGKIVKWDMESLATVAGSVRPSEPPNA